MSGICALGTHSLFISILGTPWYIDSENRTRVFDRLLEVAPESHDLFDVNPHAGRREEDPRDLQWTQ